MTEPLERNPSNPVEQPLDTARPRRRWLMLVLALVVLGAVVMFLTIAEDTVDATRTTQPPAAQQVTVETVSVKPQTAEVAAFAEIRPRWSAELRAAVSGRVEQVFDSALAGEQVEAGKELIRIEDSRYVAELAASELALKQADLALWKAENASTLARKEFERNNVKPPNDLALRLPELEIARSSVKSAKARLAAAQRQLDDTRISAPFSGFIAVRFISPGQSVNAGDALVSLVDDSVFELTVELGKSDWDLLDRPLPGSTARIIDRGGTAIAEATVRQAGGFLDDKTRQYKVFLDITDPGTGKVLPGDFVRVVMPGRTISDAVNIPASALSQEGFVWNVDRDNRLQRIAPNILFRRQDRIIIEAPRPDGEWRIAITPLISFLPGQRVLPTETGD